MSFVEAADASRREGMMLRHSFIALSTVLAVLGACNSGSDSGSPASKPSCLPNATQTCTCAGGIPGSQACVATGDAFTVCDCGTTNIPSNADSGGSVVGVDSGDGVDADASIAGDAGIGQVALLGAPCSTTGSLACAGNFQKVTLICDVAGTWQLNTTCGADDFCDSTPGPNAGVCRPSLPQCKNRMPGDTFCIEPGSASLPANLYACGPDTVTSTLVKDCRAGFSTTHPPSCRDGACIVCTPGEERCNANVPQDCNFIGGVWKWRDLSAPCMSPNDCIIFNGRARCP